MVGLSSLDYTQVFKVSFSSNIKVLNSTHTSTATYFRDTNKIVKGGGKQIFSRKLKENATFEEIK